MTFENAIDLIKQEYEKASESNYINNPLAYALYQVWKKADREIVAEKKETCGSCEWAMPIKGTINGVYVSYIECQNPEKLWNHNSSRRKKRTTPKCRFWQRKKKGGEKE